MHDQILTDAKHILGTADPHSPTRLREHLLAKGEISDYSHFSTPQPLVCVDGALATHQTDVLVWVAAAASDSESTSTARTVAVAPVSTSVGRHAAKGLRGGGGRGRRHVGDHGEVRCGLNRQPLESAAKTPLPPAVGFSSRQTTNCPPPAGGQQPRRSHVVP